MLGFNVFLVYGTLYFCGKYVLLPFFFKFNCKRLNNVGAAFYCIKFISIIVIELISIVETLLGSL